MSTPKCTHLIHLMSPPASLNAKGTGEGNDTWYDTCHRLKCREVIRYKGQMYAPGRIDRYRHGHRAREVVVEKRPSPYHALSVCTASSFRLRSCITENSPASSLTPVPHPGEVRGQTERSTCSYVRLAPAGQPSCRSGSSNLAH